MSNTGSPERRIITKTAVKAKYNTMKVSSKRFKRNLFIIDKPLEEMGKAEVGIFI